MGRCATVPCRRGAHLVTSTLRALSSTHEAIRRATLCVDEGKPTEIQGLEEARRRYLIGFTWPSEAPNWKKIPIPRVGSLFGLHRYWSKLVSFASGAQPESLARLRRSQRCLSALRSSKPEAGPWTSRRKGTLSAPLAYWRSASISRTVTESLSIGRFE